MLNRIKQVIAAITARIKPADRDFVTTNLSPAEQELFWQMNLPDQYHALNVAYTALKLAAGQAGVNDRLLMKSALLHDVGKVRGDVSTIDKIITVLAHAIAPDWARRWGRPGRGNKLNNVRHAFYSYFHHAAISAAMLERLGTSPDVIALVARHHEAPADDDPPELSDTA